VSDEVGKAMLLRPCASGEHFAVHSRRGGPGQRETDLAAARVQHQDVSSTPSQLRGPRAHE